MIGYVIAAFLIAVFPLSAIHILFLFPDSLPARTDAFTRLKNPCAWQGLSEPRREKNFSAFPQFLLSTEIAS